jgi:hypothetical protein
MAHILYYRGQGEKLMAGITEYIVIVEADKVTKKDIVGNQCPGFNLHSDIEVDEDIHFLPCEEILTPKRMAYAGLSINVPPLPMPLHPILAKHEQDVMLYESLMGWLGDIIFAMSILSDVQHSMGIEPQIVEELNEAKALIMRGINRIITYRGE